MRLVALKRVFLSKARAVITRYVEFGRERSAKVAFKDLSKHLLDDVGQANYHERRELDRTLLAISTDPFRQ